MLPFVLLLTAGYLAYLLYERWANQRARRSFQHVIHVSGIRGKTSTCRLIDAHLRGAGYRVFTKTTGSTPSTSAWTGWSAGSAAWAPPTSRSSSG